MLADRELKLKALQDHSTGLRREVEGHLAAESLLWRALLAGLAAILILDPKVELGRYVFTVPLLVGTVAVVWLHGQLMIIRSGYWLAQDEAKVDEICGEAELVRHERSLWQQRRDRFTRRRGPVVALFVALAALFLVGVLAAIQASTLPGRFLTVAAWAAAAIILALAGWTFARIWSFFQDPEQGGDSSREPSGQDSGRGAGR